MNAPAPAPVWRCRAVWCVVAAAIVWRWLLAVRTPVPSEDGVSYLWMAQRFAAGDFARGLGEVFPPGFPLLLSPWLWVGFRTRSAPAARLPAFAAALVLSVLLSPLSWKAHHVALVPVLLLLLCRAVVERRRSVWWLLGAWVVCCQLGGDLVGDAADEWGNSIYIVTAWDVLLLGIALVLAASAAREHGDAARGGEPGQIVGQ